MQEIQALYKELLLFTCSLILSTSFFDLAIASEWLSCMTSLGKYVALTVESTK